MRISLKHQKWSSATTLSLWAIVGVLHQSAIAASTEPIRNTNPVETTNPPQTINPIYYPIPATESRQENVAPETLLRLFMEQHTATQYPQAVETALRLCRLIPDRPEGHYNLACALSRLHRSNEALDALQKSIECGWRDLTHIDLDPDLANIRANARFEQIVRQLKTTIERERTVPRPLRQEPWQEIAEEVKAETPAIMSRYHVPGASIALVRDGEVVWTESFGIRDRRTSGALTRADRFRVRAPLHLFAMIAAGHQQAMGRVELAKLLVDGASLDRTQMQAGRPTSPTPTLGGEVTGVSTGSGLQRRATQTLLCPRLPNYTSDSAFGLVRLAIELASNQGFSEYCRLNVLEPLWMNATDFSFTAQGEAGLAVGHSQLGSPMDPDPKSDELALAGSIYTTSEDLARLMADMMHAQRGSQSQGGSESDSDAARSPAVNINTSEPQAKVCLPWVVNVVEQTEAMVPHGLGLAMKVVKSSHGKRIEVADNVSGLGCLMRWYPDSQVGIVVLYNSDTGSQAAHRIAQLALGGE